MGAWTAHAGRLRYVKALHADDLCLTCHGLPSAAPAALRAVYRVDPAGAVGPGFGYKFGTVECVVRMHYT